MNEESKKIFEGIKAKAEQDSELWNKSEEDESGVRITPEQEDEIMERMFLVYYTNQYLASQEKIKQLEEELSKANETIVCLQKENKELSIVQ